jgi:hypothetical protein
MKKKLLVRILFWKFEQKNRYSYKMPPNKQKIKLIPKYLRYFFYEKQNRLINKEPKFKNQPKKGITTANNLHKKW